jgi:hypothetical protein
MANTQTTVVASGIGGGTSTSIVVAAGGSITVGLFVASGAAMTPGSRASIMISTPGAGSRVAEIDHITKTTQIAGPCTFTVEKGAAGTAFGVYTEA